MVGMESTARFKVASYLDEHGASSIGEIAEGTGYSEGRVKIICDKLLKEQWIRAATSSE